MRVRLTVDVAGRIVLPKSLRQELHLQAGDALELKRVGEEITLRPVRGTVPLSKEHGVWVFRTGQPLGAAPLSASTTDEVLQRFRSERDEINLNSISE